MEGQYYDGRDDGREQQRDEQSNGYQQPQQQSQQQHLQPPQSNHHSPPSSASPFAFAPPPLSSAPGPGSSRPGLPLHHSEPAPSQQYQTSYYQPKPPLPVHANSYPFPSSVPMSGAGPGGSYRSYSNDGSGIPNGNGNPEPRSSPLMHPHSLSRTSSMNLQAPGNAPIPAQPTHSPYQYNRTISGASYSQHSPQPQTRPSPYPQPTYYPSSPYSAPVSVDMPRSLSYPNYSQNYNYLPSLANPHPHPHPHMSHPPPTLPPLTRHNTTSVIGEGVAAMDIHRPALGYSFANRLPLVDRPFKCDECVQSFNRNHDLKRHKRIHLAVKPFGCDKCGKTKDALRRHWLVKGCRGEDGATAPIVPLFPINGVAPVPALSPPSPPGAITASPVEMHPPNNAFTTGQVSYSHPAAPGPLSTLPSRMPSQQSTQQILVTPNDPNATHQQHHIADLNRTPLAVGPMDESMLDPALENVRAGPGPNGYFDGTAVDKPTSGSNNSNSSGPTSSPYPRYNSHPHPYKRPDSYHSGSKDPSPPMANYQNGGGDVKPMFTAPFTRADNQGLLAAPEDAATQMERQLSQASNGGSVHEMDGQTWQRWHRPSFPFPPPPGANFNFAPGSSPAELGQPHALPIQAAAQAYA